MANDKWKRIAASLGAATVLASAPASAATYFGNYGKADMWSEVFYTDMSRLYQSQKAYSAWPGAKSNHYSGIMAAISYGDTLDVAQVFGKDCQDLLFSNIESTNNYKDYFVDPDRALSVKDIAEHNGFLYAIAYGAKPDYSEQTVYFQYGSGETATETVVNRSSSGTNGKTGNDCYLYIFDISEGKNYGEALVAKWDISDIMGDERNAFSTFESVAVNDDVICLTVNNNKVASASEDSYDRGLIVLKNNIERGKKNIAAKRLDVADDTYEYGAKTVVDASEKNISLGVKYESFMIGDCFVMFPKSFNLTNSEKWLNEEERITIIPMNESKKSVVGDTKYMYLSTMYNEEPTSIGTALSEILPYRDGKTWYDATDPKVWEINVSESELTFLVTYKETVGGKTTWYKRIYITDWSDPKAPKLIGDYEWVDKNNTNGGNSGLDNSLFCYEGYYYIPDNYGIDVIKKFDENGLVNPSYITSYNYEAGTWGTVKKVDVFVSGNYMWVWNDYDYNTGYEGRMKLKADKSAIEEFCGFGQNNRSRTENNSNDIIRYNERVYLLTTPNLYASMPGAVNVVDLSRAMPMSVTIDSVPKEVSLPYTIEGSAVGADKVQISIDQKAVGYADVSKSTDGTYRWKYTVTNSGTHSISAAAVPFGTTVIEDTRDYCQYTGVSAEEISISGSASPLGNKLESVINISNSGLADINGRLIVGIYKDDVLYSLGISDDIRVNQGESKTVDNISVDFPTFLKNYEVKVFLTKGSHGFAPMTSSVTLSVN